VLRNADAFINTYWIRFPYAGVGFEDAIQNIELLIERAHAVSVGRFVQVGVSNSSTDSTLGYYRGKAIVDECLRASAIPHAIVRPTLVVGPKDVLTSNIAWFIRRSPLIAIPRGDGYELQPVTIEDTARIIADCTEASGNMEVDAAGPDRMTFGEYVELLASSMGKQRKLVTVSPTLMLRSLSIAGTIMRDIVLTREELEGLEQNLLVSHEAPLGRTPVSQTIAANANLYGRRYVNDTRLRFRHYR
jgi:NADH dehydrogenase